MRKICHKNIQRQVASLVPILELCISLIAETEQTKNQLNILPLELDSLKEKADKLNNKINAQQKTNLQFELQQMEFELDSLVNDLDGILIALATFDRKVKNTVALQERLEALQQERLDSITPERIYKLLEKQPRSQNKDTQTISKSQDKIFLSEKATNIKQKIINVSHKFRHPRIIISLSILASLSLGWVAGYYSSLDKIQLSEDQKIENSID
ncbi:MAG: hypothetical protein Tsb0014_18510 [Pleurocapsa sp.]